jgi:hypothetical protein
MKQWWIQVSAQCAAVDTSRQRGWGETWRQKDIVLLTLSDHVVLS